MRKATLLIAFLLLTSMSTGCDPDTTTGERPVHCEVLVDSPVKADNADKMVGKVRFNCDKPGAEKLTLSMKLEKRDGDKWHTVASATHTARGLDTHAAGFEHQSRLIELKCGAGVYRTVVDWSRVSRKNTKGDNLVSGVVRDPCQKL